MSADEVLYSIRRGRERTDRAGEYNWLVIGNDTVLCLPSQGEAEIVVRALTHHWSCKAPDGKHVCEFAKYCKYVRQRIQILGNLRGEACEFFTGLRDRAKSDAA